MELFSSTPNTTTINKEVSIGAYYFRPHLGDLRSFPRQMELDGAQYYFDGGLRYLVRKGQEIVQLFDMSDGQTTFRLRNTGDDWRLVSMKAAA